MSSLMNTTLATKIARFREKIKRLKATQIIGGDNMGYYEYTTQNASYTLNAHSGVEFYIIVEAEKPFPLVSVELDLYENGELRKNPYSANSIPYNASRYSTLSYNFIDLSTSGNYDHNVRVDSIWYSTDSPNTHIELVTAGNYNNPATTVELKNIKIRTTCPAKCFIYTYGWQG